MKIKSRTEIVELMKHFELPLVAAEIGTAEGRWSTELIALGIEVLYLVDVWDRIPFIEGCASFEQSWHDKNYLEVKNRFKDNENVVLLKGFSYKMAASIPDNSLGLAYIDCDHSFAGCRSDIDSYYPKLVQNGIMCFHDARNPSYGVERAIWDFTKGIGINELVEDGEINNMGAWIQKK